MIPELIAHRGEMTRYPENTLLALRAAIDAGAKYVEFDIQLSKNQTPMVCHDAGLERTTGHTGRIMDYPAGQLRDIRADHAHPTPRADAEVRIPPLAQVVESLNTRPCVTAFIEVKRESLDHFGRQATVDKVLDCLAAARFSWVLLSFDDAAVAYARERMAVPVGWAFREYSPATRDKAERLSPEYLFCKYERLPDNDEALWNGPWQWVIYDIRQAKPALALAARGAHLIETGTIVDLLQQAPFKRPPPA